MFFFKCSKFYVDLKNEIKFQQKVFGFLDSVWDSFFIVKEFRYLHFFFVFCNSYRPHQIFALAENLEI